MKKKKLAPRRQKNVEVPHYDYAFRALIDAGRGPREQKLFLTHLLRPSASSPEKRATFPPSTRRFSLHTCIGCWLFPVATPVHRVVTPL